MQRELRLLREMRDSALAIRSLIGERTADEIDVDAMRRAADRMHFTVSGGIGQPATTTRRLHGVDLAAAATARAAIRPT